MGEKLAATNSGYFPALTGVRALAAYMVFVHHFIPVKGNPGEFPLENMSGELHIGVTFFFVLSGFLIHHRYSRTESWNWPVLRSYLLARAARIMPLFIILTLFTALVLGLLHMESVSKLGVLLFFNLTLLKGFAPGLNFSLISQAWSLTVEFCFYLFAPFLFTRVQNPLLYPRVSAILLALGFLGVALFSFFPAIKGIEDNYWDNRFMLSYSFLGRSFEFFMGCYLSTQLGNWSKGKSEGGFYTWFGLVVCFLALYVLSTFRQPKIYGVHTFPGLLVNNFFLPVAIVLFFRGLLFEKTWLSDFLGSKLMVKLGQASYAFYLIHVGVIQKGIAHGLEWLAGKTDFPLFWKGLFGFLQEHTFLFQFLVLNILSWFLFSLIEEPLNLFFRNRIRRPSSKTP